VFSRGHRGCDPDGERRWIVDAIGCDAVIVASC
jgi:hypothetical protein